MVNRTETALTDAGLTRRKLLALLGGGTAAGLVLGSQPWFRSAFATTEPPGPIVPVPTLPDPVLGPPPAVPTVADLAATLEWDVDKMFRYVADEVAFEPYVGALRGATGALWAKAGNAVDKALLLGALLTEAGVPHHFVRGEIGEPTGESEQGTAEPDADAVARRMAAVLLPTDVVGDWDVGRPWRRAPDFDALLATARQRVDSTVEMITAALAAEDISLPTSEPPTEPAQPTSHVWIQYADGPDWIDLDPSRPGAEPATAYGSAAETFDELPEDLYHTVTIRLTAEVVSGGQLTPTELLSHTVRSADVCGVPVVIVHPTSSWLGIEGAITGDQGYQPTLLVGDVVVEGGTVTLTTGEGAIDVLSDEASAADGQTVAEWLEVEVAVPGRPAPGRTSRAIFDRLSAEDRVNDAYDLASLPNVELTHIDDEIGDVFLPFAGSLILSIAGGMLPSSLFEADPSQEDPSSVLLQSASAFHSLRDLCELEFLEPFKVHGYYDEPTVVAVKASPTSAGALAEQTAGAHVDIVHLHRRNLSLAGSATDVNAGLLAGALDHAAERLLVDGMALTMQGDVGEVSAGRVFELAAEQGIATVVLSSANRALVADMPGAARPLLDAALDAGRVVVIPAQPVTLNSAPRIGWWEIDPATGDALDRMDDGGREAAPGYAFLLRVFTAVACTFAVLGVIGFVMKVAAGRITHPADALTESASAGGALAGCVAGGLSIKVG